MLVGQQQTRYCNKCSKNARVERWDHFCQPACLEPVSFLYYSRPPVTPCYRGSARCYKMRSRLDFTRLLSALTVQPSAAQLRVIRNACSCRAPHQPISWPPGAGCWLGKAKLWWRGSWPTQGTACCRNTVLRNDEGYFKMGNRDMMKQFGTFVIV